NTSVTSLNPGTVYYLRVQATSHVCRQTTGGPCSNGVFSRVGYLISLADGCEVNGHSVPPVASIDTGLGSNYTAYFYIETLTGADFQTSLYFKVGGICSPDPNNCGAYLWADQGSSTRSVFFDF